MNVNEIDMNKLHLAAKPVQFVVALILAIFIVGAGYIFMFKDQIETWNTAKERETQLKDEYTQLSSKVANLENLEEELKLIEASIQDLIKDLPTEAELPDLLNELNRAATDNRLTIAYMTPREPFKEDDNIERLPFAIKVEGNYDQISKFVRDVGRLSRIVTLSHINIMPKEPYDVPKLMEEMTATRNTKKKKIVTDEKLIFSAIASTYKAIDTPPPADASAASETVAQ